MAAVTSCPSSGTTDGRPTADGRLQGKSMRAEIERLVEEIKQSVGLLRRHL
jgi:hypothetical protein